MNILQSEVYSLKIDIETDRNSLIIYNNIYKTPDNHSTNIPVFFRSVCTRYPQESVSRPEGIYFHQILIVLDGEGLVKCNGKCYTLKKGCGFFVEQKHPVEYINVNGLTSAFISVNGSAMDALTKHYAPDGFIFYDSVSVERYVSDFKSLIHEYFSHNREGILSSLTYSICTSFFEEQNRKLSKFDEVVLYIEKNFAKKITLAELSQIGCISVSKL